VVLAMLRVYFPFFYIFDFNDYFRTKVEHLK